MRTILVSLLVALSASCVASKAEIHQPLDAARFESLEPGTSTAAEVVQALGAPTDVVQLGKRSAYRYDHLIEKQTVLFLVVVNLRGVDTQADRAWVFFDKDDVLTHVAMTLESDTAEHFVPPFD